MTAFLIFLKHRFPWLWRSVECVNGWLFGLFYPGFARTAEHILHDCISNGYRFSLVGREDIESLSAFLNSQPEESRAYFAPHKFDSRTLERLYRNKAFLLMKVTDLSTGCLAGYFFLRCFWLGRAFHGLLVSSRLRNKGIGTSMWMLAQKICQAGGLRMFATVSSHNVSSMKAACRGTSVRIVRELDNGYRLLECTSREL